MAELDQHRPTTSSFHRPTMEEAVVKMKRLQRFTRQFSIYVHCEGDKLSKVSTSKNSEGETESELVPEQVTKQEDENNEDRLFKYPGNLRAVKRKRSASNQPVKKVDVASAKRKMMEHQKSIREEETESPTEIEKYDNSSEEKVSESSLN